MNITDYVENTSLEERMKHIDLESPCMDATRKNNWGESKAGDFLSTRSKQYRRAKENLRDFLELSGDTTRYIHTCHKCSHNTPNGGKCVNPQHIYFGTINENAMDKDQEVRSHASSIGAKAQLAKGKHNFQKQNRWKWEDLV